MLFNSLEFLIFFPLVTLIYFLLPHKYRWLHLLIASCIFYMAFIPVYIFILFFTIIIDYIAGIMIENETGRRRKLFLTASIIANVGVLAVFKYYNFFTINVNHFLHSLHITPNSIPLLQILLPIGLSFHTFQAMSYTIEVYRGNQKAERHFGIYALYVMFYPQLVAGPIERPQNLLHQFREPHPFDSQNLLNGLRLMLWGFFKKMVIADRLSQYTNTVFNQPYGYHYLNLVIATIFFSIQIYCDFSGYSDIAIGAAKTMGFDLMTNFNRPYFSKNIQEFWRKWHISLSTWFKDYVYISLGGNRKGIRRMYFNVAVVFLLSGFWHGANFTYIVWGALHTIFIFSYMLIERHYSLEKILQKRALIFFTTIFTFSIVSFAWIFFRANTISDALLICKHIFGLYHSNAFQLVLKDVSGAISFTKSAMMISVTMIALMFSIEKILPPNLITLNKKPFTDILFCSITLSLIILIGVFNNNSFIYFQF
ncbi:MAG TPA: MBOAT family O-acyltransferase [Ferruginibacter sp.]|jgi:alginate O-acetyltransferase complex protein AlgI|nr:MBOAT family O-acyltransferase [Ferruginibacter sp.]